MTVPRFPLDPDVSVGRFWVAGPELGERSDGMCRVDGAAIEVEVVKPLTQWLRPLDDAPGVLVPTREESDWVIHGELPISPGPVTFLGVRTAGRRSNYFPTGSEVTELHRMRAEWCIAGAQIEGTSTRYTGVRARFSHLELWAKTEGLVTIVQTTPSLKHTVVYEPAQAHEVAFQEFNEAATLRLSSTATFGSPNVWGAQITTADWLELEGLSGWTLEEVLARFVRPVEVLLTILAGAQCHTTHLEVRVEDRWCPVYGGAVKSHAARPADEALLLDRHEMGLAALAEWCGVTARLSPGAHVIASSVADAFSTLPSQALALTTTAEGIDRVLYAGSRRFSKAQVEDSLKALKSSEVPAEVQQVLSDALNTYLFEPSYPKRMRRLAEAIADTAPGCVGETNRWAAEMTDLRVGLAHALDQQSSSTDDALWRMHARVQSLEWALTLRILLEATIPAETLAQALGRSERYRKDQRRWRSLMPRVFPEEEMGS